MNRSSWQRNSKHEPNCEIKKTDFLADLSDVVEIVYLWAESAVDAEELLVHERGQREAVERVHARVVHALRVLDLAWKLKMNFAFSLVRMTEKRVCLTLLLEGEVFREMSALVVASQEEERVGVDQLQGPQVDHALDNEDGEII